MFATDWKFWTITMRFWISICRQAPPEDGEETAGAETTKSPALVRLPPAVALQPEWGPVRPRTGAFAEWTAAREDAPGDMPPTSWVSPVSDAAFTLRMYQEEGTRRTGSVPFWSEMSMGFERGRLTSSFLFILNQSWPTHCASCT